MDCSFLLDNGGTITFATDAGGVLCLGPGTLRFDARFSEQYRDAESWYAVIGCELRVADADGGIWRGSGAFLSSGLLYPLIDLSRREPARWWRHAPAAWVKALEERALISGIPATYDDRFYRYVWIDNTGLSMQFKYLGASFEIAALTPHRLLVRVADLFGSWNPLPVAGPDGAPVPLHTHRLPRSPEELDAEDRRQQESGESGDYENIPPLGYEISAGRLLFLNTAWQDGDGRWWGDLKVSRPLVFQRARGKAEAQQSVVYCPGRRAAPPARANPADEASFAQMTWDNGARLEFLTNAGGRLMLEAGKLTVWVRLDRHPGSATKPGDVLRCRVRLADAQGALWESCSLFTPEVFVEKLVNLDAISILSFQTSEDAWQPSQGGLLGVRALLPDSAWRYVLLCEDLVALKGDQQEATIDVRPQGEGFAVRLSGLVGRRRPAEIDHGSRYVVLDPEARAHEVNCWEQDRPLPPFQYRLSFAELAFRNTTFGGDQGFQHHNAIPIPVVFARVGRGEPHEGVQFLADPDQDVTWTNRGTR